MTRAVPLLLLTAIVGCGGGSSVPEARERPQPAPEPVAAGASDARPAIVALGDSITAGYGLAAGEGYPELLQRMLDEKGLAYRVVNMGVSGDTTGGALARIPGVLAVSPKVVIVEIGGNDGLRGIPVSSSEANLDEILKRLKASGAHVLLAGMTLPSNYGAEYIASFEKMYERLAAIHGVKLMPIRLEKIAELGDPATLMQNDGLHPTAEGQRRLAQYVFGYLTPALGG